MEPFYDKFDIPDVGELSDKAVTLLLNELGVAQFLSDKQCVKGRPPFLEPAWNSGKKHER